MNIRTKRTICRVLGAAAMLAMILLVGGTEMGWMPFGKGMALAAACEIGGAALLWKGGVIRFE
ncbi:MAG: hypothetical protein IKN89_02335 [Oscillospiraceae bacterium]|nr:hypothetical protein [Oscillospiraceae bacterium]